MKRFTLSLLVTVLCTLVQAQSWVDITNSYVTNPNFNGNADGWNVTFNYNTSDTRGYQKESYSNASEGIQISGFLEAWAENNSSVQWYHMAHLGDGYLYQELENLPSGKLRLEADVIAVDQNQGNNPVTGAYLFIENEDDRAETEIHTSNASPEHFSVEFENKGEISFFRIGICTESTTANWIAMDNVKLSWYGTQTYPSSITLSTTSLSLKQGQVALLTANVLPSSATDKSVTWSSSNTAIATVSANGQVYAKGIGTATITCTSVSKPSVKKTCAVTITANTIADNLDESKWANITGSTIQNPNFDNNPTWYGEWTIKTTCQNNTYDYGAQEFFNGTSDIYQTVIVPEPGIYRIGVKAYYRAGDYSYSGWSQYNNGTEDITAFLYANDFQTPLQSAYSEYLSQSVSGLKAISTDEGYRYFPNNMNTAVNNFFADGKYQNYIIVEVGDDCELTIGIRNENALSSNWIIMDDWTLEQYGGTEVAVESIQVDPTSLSLGVGDYSWIDYIVLPDNASDKSITVTANPAGIVSFNVYSDYIYVQALTGGTTEITFASKSDPSVKTVVPVTVTAPATGITLNRTTASLKVDEKLTLSVSLQPNYSTDDPAVTWSSSDKTVATVSTAGIVTAKKAGTATITATLKANTDLTATCEVTVYNKDDIVKEWLDMTESFVDNPYFSGSTNGWVVNYNGSTSENYGYQSANYSNNDVWISKFAETWRNQNNYYNPLGDGSIYQFITGLPTGHYKLEADVIAVSQNFSYRNPVTGAYLFIANSTEEALTEVATGNGAPEHFSVEFDTDETDLTIGVRTENTTANWLAFDNVKLQWYGTEVKATSLSLNTTSKELVQGETLQLIPTLTPENTTFKTCYFESSNTACVTVDANGLVTAVKPGMSTITVTTKSNDALSATCIITVGANEVSANAVIINEVQQANVDMFVDPSFNYGGWVELYNSTNQSVTLNGLYISDDPSEPKKFALSSAFHGAVPAKGFCTLWFDHYSWWSLKMVDLKLDCDGGVILIANEEGTILSRLDYPPAITRTSYARKTNGGSEWGYTDQPTPGASNTTSKFAEVRLAAPEIDTDGCLFDGTLLAQVTNIPAGATLRYTLDGSTPTLKNGLTSDDGLFSFDATAILRLRYFQDGYLASPVTTRSYIHNQYDDDGNKVVYTLPIISLVSDNKHLYGDELGIFVQGTNGRPGNGKNYACNWNMDWDRPANIEYFTEEGQATISQEVSIEASGGWSRAWYPHSFNIKANKIYEGNNRMDYQFFENKPYLRHKALKVRNGGNNVQDNGSGRIKDGAIQTIVASSGLYVETQSYKPVHVFHNGAYIGVENLREPNNKSYADANYGIDTDEQDQWKMSPDSNYVQQAGTKDVFDQWYTLAQNANDALAYEQIKQIVDIEEYANYMAVELYLGGHDWPKNNIKGFRERSEGLANSRFRHVLFDLDAAFASGSPFDWFESTQTWTFDPLYGELVLAKYGSRITDEIEFVTIFKNMLKNEEFKKQFIDQFCLVVGSVFEPNRSKEIINEIVARVNPAMALEERSANSTGSHLINNITTSRQSSSYTYLNNFMSYGTSLQVTLASNISEARLLVNDLQVPTNKFSGRLYPPITLKASAPAGYQFLGWQSSKGGSNSTSLFTKGSSWSYYDQGSLDGEGWTAKDYSGTWSSGNAPLGYDTGNATKAAAYNTTLSYGSNSSNKYPTYYFRKQVNLSTAPQSDETFTLDWIADDGFVVYVNGTEAGRFLMDKTPNPTFNSFADTYANANPESGQMSLSASLFQKGNNVIAVELHNNSASSTDVYWDAGLTYAKKGDAGSYVCYDESFTIPTDVSSVTYTAVYDRLNDNADDAWDAHPIKINEVSAANEIFVNDYFKKNDWIELYNTTDQDYDVNGMYLSDNLSKPEKFQIIDDGTCSTVIPAHGHLVIWCDTLQNVSQLHANFKLTNKEKDKRNVLLTAADKSWADTLSYCVHTGYQSVGLFPDGSSNVYVMNRPTIGQTNVLTTAALSYEEPKIEPQPIPDTIEGVDDTDMALHYKNRALTLEGVPYARVDIYNTSGQLVMTARLNAATSLSLANLPQGIYVATAKTDDDQVTLKFSHQ